MAFKKFNIFDGKICASVKLTEQKVRKMDYKREEQRKLRVTDFLKEKILHQSQ